MAFAPTDLTSTQLQAITDNAENLNIESFKKEAMDKYGISELGAELIFSQANAKENGATSDFLTDTLSQESFDDLLNDVKVFQQLKTDLKVDKTTGAATKLLTGDMDGEMIKENVDTLIDEGYLEVDSTNTLKTTSKGNALLSFINSDPERLKTKHTTQNLEDFENSEFGKIDYQQTASIQDGEISKNYSQNTNNCWVLGGVDALASSIVGSDIVKDSIVDKGNGDYSVTFPGDPSGKEYEVSAEEIQESTLTSADSDLDSKITSIAVDKLLRNSSSEELQQMGIPESVIPSLQKNGITAGGDMRFVFNLYNDDSFSTTQISGSKDILDFLETNADQINAQEFPSVLGANLNKYTGAMTSADTVGHAFIIDNVDSDSQTVTYHEPNSPNTRHEISFTELDEVLKKSAGGLTVGLPQ